MSDDDAKTLGKAIWMALVCIAAVFIASEIIRIRNNNATNPDNLSITEKP